MSTQMSDIAIADGPETQISADVSSSNQVPVLPGANSSEVSHQRMQMIGAIVALMQNSPLHRRYSIAALEERFIPSLLHNQFRYYEINGSPVGFVNWAWLNEETEAKFSTGNYQLNLNEWKCGSSLWFPELIAPFGHARIMVKDLRKNVLPKGTPAKALRVSAQGQFKGIATYRV